MAQFPVVCFICASLVIGLATANAKALTSVQSDAESSSNHQQPAPSPSNGDSSFKPQPPINRKLGNHHKVAMAQPSIGPSLSPFPVRKADENLPSATEQEAAYMPNSKENVGIRGEETLLAKPRHHHHSVDKSVAGGGVILGGLATTFLVAVLCYIRATRRCNSEITS